MTDEKKEWPWPWDRPISHYDTNGPKKPTRFKYEGVNYFVGYSGDSGITTGRDRFHVACLGCATVLHSNTTSPSNIIQAHHCKAAPEGADALPNEQQKLIRFRCVVSGQPKDVEIDEATLLEDVVEHVLKTTGNVGRPAYDWELRRKSGALIDLQQPVGEAVVENEILFLNPRAGVSG